MSPFWEPSCRELAEWFGKNCSAEATWEVTQLRALLTGMNRTASPGFPYKQAGFDNKGQVLDDPNFFDFWRENELPHIIIPSGKVELVDQNFHSVNKKVRTFFPVGCGAVVSGYCFYGKQSIKFLENGRNAIVNNSWNFYGWSPFFGGCNSYANILVEHLLRGCVITSFDVRGYDRDLTLVEDVACVRRSSILNFGKFPPWLKSKFDAFFQNDIAPTVLTTDGENTYLYRNLFNPSGKYGTTETNSLSHKMIKNFHYNRLSYSGPRRDILYSDDNVNISLPYVQTLDIWKESYAFFGKELRDFVLVSSLSDIGKIHFLGFSIRKHWVHTDFWSPVYDEDRIKQSLFISQTKDITIHVQKWWGLCLLAYSASEQLFEFFFRFFPILAELDPECPLTKCLSVRSDVIRFYDNILFGFEAVDLNLGTSERTDCLNFLNHSVSLFLEEGGIKIKEDEFVSQAKISTETNHRFSKLAGERETVETAFV
jgi:hypothetical protein